MATKHGASPSRSPSTAGRKDTDVEKDQGPETCQDVATVAFLALGSLGDTLPLCALAADLPRHCREYAHKISMQERESDPDQGHEVRGKRRRTRQSLQGSSRVVRCTVITHRSQTEVLEGVYQRYAEPKIFGMPCRFNPSIYNRSGFTQDS